MKLRNKITKEICDAEMREDGIYIKANWSDEEKWFRYDLETLARGWDYYAEPKEPLIKDEKVRKAIMAWYEALPLEHMSYKKILFRQGFFCVGIYCIDCGNYNAVKGIKERYYSIEELCGEEYK